MRDTKMKTVYSYEDGHPITGGEYYEETSTTYCTNCAEVNSTDNELCKDCRMVEVHQVQEWLSELLVDSTGMVKIGTLTYEPIRVLKSVDPIAYNEMYLDMCDSLARDGYIIRNYNDHE